MDEKFRSVFLGELYSFWVSIDIFVGLVFIMNFVVVSFDCYLVIIVLFLYSELLILLRVIIMIVVLWVFFILFCGLYVFLVKMVKMCFVY